MAGARAHDIGTEVGEEVAKLLRVLSVAVEDQVMLLEKKAVERIGQIASYLEHEATVGIGRNPGDVNAASGELREEENVVGLAQLGSFDFPARAVEFSMLIDPKLSECRQETSAKAARQIVDYVFDYLNYNKIYCKLVVGRNTLRERLEKYGFRLEGTLRKSIQGKDEWLLGLLKEDRSEEKEWHS